MMLEFTGYVQHGTFGVLRKIKKEMKFPILRMLELFLEREKNIGLTCESDHVTSLNWLEKKKNTNFLLENFGTPASHDFMWESFIVFLFFSS